jgi:hypothetical protein
MSDRLMSDRILGWLKSDLDDDSRARNRRFRDTICGDGVYISSLASLLAPASGGGEQSNGLAIPMIFISRFPALSARSSILFPDVECRLPRRTRKRRIGNSRETAIVQAQGILGRF